MTRPYCFLSALVLVIGCGTGGGGGQSPTAERSPGLSLPSNSTPPPPPVQPSEADQAIVSFLLIGGPDARPVDVTFTGADGAPVTVEGASPGTWSKGGFWPVGASISMSATTGDAGNRDFSCEIRANGTRHTSAAKARIEGNDIVGWECEIGPVIVESVL
jgi:hypothetical protein